MSNHKRSKYKLWPLIWFICYKYKHIHNIEGVIGQLDLKNLATEEEILYINSYILSLSQDRTIFYDLNSNERCNFLKFIEHTFKTKIEQNKIKRIWKKLIIYTNLGLLRP